MSPSDDQTLLDCNHWVLDQRLPNGELSYNRDDELMLISSNPLSNLYSSRLWIGDAIFLQ
jgi:hypothetical protein